MKIKGADLAFGDKLKLFDHMSQMLGVPIEAWRRDLLEPGVEIVDRGLFLNLFKRRGRGGRRVGSC